MSQLSSISNVDDLRQYFETKIQTLQRVVDLTCSLDSEDVKNLHNDIYKELDNFEEILDKLEEERDRKRALLKQTENLIGMVKRVNEAFGMQTSMAIENHQVIPAQRVSVASVMMNAFSEERRNKKASTNEYLEEAEMEVGHCRNPRVPPHKEDIRIHPTLLFVTELARVDESDLARVPSYLRGRLTPDKVNSVVDVLNRACSAKYDVIKTPKSKQSDRIRNAIREYRDQETKETQGYNFIVEKDIVTHTQVKVDKNFLNIVTILRVIGRLKEVRGNNLLRYVFVGGH